MALNKKQQSLMVVALAVVVVALLAAEAAAAITCDQVASSLMPCVGYATGRGTLTPDCCSGVRSLNSLASSTADRHAACRCLKGLVGSLGTIDTGAVAGIPAECGVDVGSPISMSVDCDKIH